jgi:hypothetical protein
MTLTETEMKIVEVSKCWTQAVDDFEAHPSAVMYRRMIKKRNYLNELIQRQEGLHNLEIRKAGI